MKRLRSGRDGQCTWLVPRCSAQQWPAWSPSPSLTERPCRRRKPLHFDIATPQSRDPASFSVSPNGQYIAYEADADGRSQLWVRDLRSGVARVLAGPTAPRFPFWSPNSRSIGFVSQGRLMRVDLAGGAARDLAAAPGGRWGGAWGGRGVIVFVATNGSGVLQIPEDGGTAQR